MTKFFRCCFRSKNEEELELISSSSSTSVSNSSQDSTNKSVKWNFIHFEFPIFVLCSSLGLFAFGVLWMFLSKNIFLPIFLWICSSVLLFISAWEIFIIYYQKQRKRDILTFFEKTSTIICESAQSLDTTYKTIKLNLNNNRRKSI
ncbi:GPR153 [Lepeophtheirus salmonis]|uniref:GPR153 n=1 Tax=Lepeophtheirus salmonis TaxID=72036 RepID=A0A7R8H9X4_LEPSM|nr:GPR153 [Lepeophtheirus salmonis]CAF2956275.1 GPR153 [Lepeophtheirus salmonis]